MNQPLLLRPKLHRPPVPGDHVRRPRLLERLEAARRFPAVLVSAPAGYGKTTLVASWLEECDRPSAWVSLDEGDNDLHRFLNHFVAAVHSLFAAAVNETLALLASPTLPPVQVITETLANELDEVENEFVLVLDDIHLIRSQAVNEVLERILRQPPRPLQLVFLGRRDPVLSVASLRARGMLTELRMSDLCFTEDESTAFLRAAAGEELSVDTALQLAEGAEGWVTGLRLAILARNAMPERALALPELKGTPRYVADYLLAEVLDRQAASVRHMLLCTSVLRRISAPLCDALMQGSEELAGEAIDGEAFLEWLQRHNLFVVPLDAEARWFRYHHLFAELLSNELRRSIGEEAIRALHARASAWLEEAGAIEEAIHHALASGSAECAADIVERGCDSQFDANRWYVVKHWLELIPTETVWGRIRLLLAQAAVYEELSRVQDVPPLVERARELAETSSVDPAVQGELLHFLGYIQFFQGDGEASLVFLERALELVPESPAGCTRAELELYVGLALHISGRGDEALRRIDASIDRRHLRTGLLWERLVFGAGVIHLMSAELAPARRCGETMLEDARRLGTRYIETWAHYLIGTAAFHEHDLGRALEHFGEVIRDRYMAHTRAALDCMAGAAIAAQLLGRRAEADDALQAAREYANWSEDPGNVESALACEARVALLRGDHDTALRWQHGFRGAPNVPGMLFFLVDTSITECRVLAATGEEAGLREAAQKLELLRRETSGLHFDGQVIEITAVQALVADRLGYAEEALGHLREAVALSAPGGWIRPFVELGPPLAALLRQLPARDPNAAHVAQILAACGAGPTAAGTADRVPHGALVEPLTHRELDVLELLAGRLQNKEIAVRLSVSPMTVKSHLRSIYQKLEVSKRREAVQRASALGLLP